jgi:hypothetical protein
MPVYAAPHGVSLYYCCCYPFLSSPQKMKKIQKKYTSKNIYLKGIKKKE